MRGSNSMCVLCACSLRTGLVNIHAAMIVLYAGSAEYRTSETPVHASLVYFLYTLLFLLSRAAAS